MYYLIALLLAGTGFGTTFLGLPATLSYVLYVFAGLVTVVRIVPQGYNANITTFGKFSRTVMPGINFIIPLVQAIELMNLMEQVLDIDPQDVITSDNVGVTTDGVVFFRITDPVKAAYEVNDLERALVNLTMTQLRNVIGELELDKILSSRDEINVKLLKVVDEASDPWGVKVTRVEIKDLSPPADIRDAMARQMNAERDRRAEVLQAEGDKQAKILRAEGEKEAAIREAEGRKEAADLDALARERLAEAEAKAVTDVNTAIAAGEGEAVAYFLGLKQVEALGKFAEHQGEGTIVVPAEFSALAASFSTVAKLMSKAD